MKNLAIRPESERDREAVSEINRTAFGQPDEAELIARLRSEGVVVVSLVADMDGRAVGHILFSCLEVAADERKVKAVSLAPMAVLPECQGRGVGSALVRSGLEACRVRGIEAVVVLGHADYYPRFGFRAEWMANFRAPFSGDAFMGVELKEGALRCGEGRVVYPKAFGL